MVTFGVFAALRVMRPGGYDATNGLAHQIVANLQAIKDYNIRVSTVARIRGSAGRRWRWDLRRPTAS